MKRNDHGRFFLMLFFLVVLFGNRALAASPEFGNSSKSRRPLPIIRPLPQVRPGAIQSETRPSRAPHPSSTCSSGRRAQTGLGERRALDLALSEQRKASASARSAMARAGAERPTTGHDGRADRAQQGLGGAARKCCAQ
jgi:hypothetical protein